MTESEGARLLGQHVRDRRDQLGYTGLQLAERLGIAQGSVYSIEHGRAPRRATRAALERELLWRPGSCEKVLAGGEPDALPLPTSAAIVVSPQVRVWLEELERLDEETQRKVLRISKAIVRAELDDD